MPPVFRFLEHGGKLRLLRLVEAVIADAEHTELLREQRDHRAEIALPMAACAGQQQHDRSGLLPECINFHGSSSSSAAAPAALFAGPERVRGHPDAQRRVARTLAAYKIPCRDLRAEQLPDIGDQDKNDLPDKRMDREHPPRQDGFARAHGKGAADNQQEHARVGDCHGRHHAAVLRLDERCRFFPAQQRRKCARPVGKRADPDMQRTGGGQMVLSLTPFAVCDAAKRSKSLRQSGCWAV